AARDPHGRWAAIGGKHANFELTRWLEHDGDKRNPREVDGGKVFHCDPLGCVVKEKGQSIAIDRLAAALRDDCRRSELLVWLGSGKISCDGPDHVITRQELTALGTHAVRLPDRVVPLPTPNITGTGVDPARAGAMALGYGAVASWLADFYRGSSSSRIEIRTVEDERGQRPWTRNVKP
ncbi:MAG: hypothetical protein ACK5JT_17845, partial [Hyphomicrobiaceae bacterium]